MLSWPSLAQKSRALGDRIVQLSPLPRASDLPQSRAAVLVRAAVHVVALVVVFVSIRDALRPIFKGPRPTAIRAEGPGDQRYELDEKTRKEIFSDLAALEQKTRADGIAQNTWNGHLWSRDDDRGWGERVRARSIAQTRGISLTQVFLILEEGIRNRWPGPDGKPLPATVPPLNLRTGW